MKPIRIHYLQHVPFEGLGYIKTWIEENKHTSTSTKFYENFLLPEQSEFDWLIVMGGPMGIYDDNTYPWLVKEKAFIKQTIQAGKVVLGICLGAQLIADALGARVFPNKEKEIGWLPIFKTPLGKQKYILTNFPDSQIVFHWHGDTYDIPNGAEHLFYSEACTNQAFIYNKKVLALQFHIEITPESISSLVNACRNELVSAKFIQSENEIIEKIRCQKNINDLLATILNKLAAR